MRKTIGILLVVGTNACVRYTPPGPAPARAATSVSASSGKTWDAVIDAFAANNIPIRTMERASGFIATEMLGASLADRAYADCGQMTGLLSYAPTSAAYNVLVRGDSARSTVRVTVRWIRAAAPPYAAVECTSRGYWESGFEAEVQARAEGRTLPTPIARATITEIPTYGSRGYRIFAWSLLGLGIIGAVIIAATQ